MFGSRTTLCSVGWKGSNSRQTSSSHTSWQYYEIETLRLVTIIINCQYSLNIDAQSSSLGSCKKKEYAGVSLLFKAFCRYKKYRIICLIRNETIHIHIRDSEPGVMFRSRDLNTDLWLVDTGPDVHRLETFMCSPPGPREHFRTRSYFILLLFLYVCTLYSEQ